MLLLDAALGADAEFDTRLMQEMRIKRGLVYAVGSSYHAWPDGALLAMFDCPPRDTASARKLARDVIDGMATRPPSGTELERVRRKLIAAVPRADATLDGILDRLATTARNPHAADTPTDLARRLEAVSAADVARVAHKVFRADRLVEVDEGPAR
jgi:predicted Zn-dependent peptidase